MKTKIIMLPTEDKTDIVYNTYCITKAHGNPLIYVPEMVNSNNLVERGYKYQHLYLINDSEIKEGDWYLNNHNEIWQYGVNYPNGMRLPDGCKKIIATTDPKLKIYKFKSSLFKNLEYSLPQIPQSFIKEYCERGGVDEVEIELDQCCGRCNDVDDECQGDTIKVNSDNTVNLSFIKESYSREEVENLINSFADHVYKGYYVHKWDVEDILDTTEKWIKENLK